METFPQFSYTLLTLAYFILLCFLLIRVKKNVVNIPGIITFLVSFVWSGYTVYIIHNNNYHIEHTFSLELFRYLAWYFFLTVLISKQQFNSQYFLLRHSWQVPVIISITFIVAILASFTELHSGIQLLIGFDFKFFVLTAYAVLGLILVEQLYQNAMQEQRWSVKFLCIGLASLFVFDFVLYSKSLLFSILDVPLWEARGIINLLVLPLILISLNRLSKVQIKVQVSNKVLLHTSVLFAAGFYLLLISLAGYYIKNYGGSWGAIAQITFIFLSLLFLFIFVVSGKIRALVKIYFSKHLFQHRYDYREEWIRLSKSIAELTSLDDLSNFIISTMESFVDCTGGGLWIKNDRGDYYRTAEKNIGDHSRQLVRKEDVLISFLTTKEWVIDFVEYVNNPTVYAGVGLELWHTEFKDIWLIIPFFQKNELQAFVVLTKPRVSRQIDWEEHDLLKTVGMQLANALALTQASDDLSRARQFEAYSRFSAFLVHDLKNLVAQISLIVRNSEKHKRNPEFVDDSIDTLKNVVKKIERLLSQLQTGNLPIKKSAIIDLATVLDEVKIQQATNNPKLEFTVDRDEYLLIGSKDKMVAIIGHLVQNAQEATDDNGFVRIEVEKNEHYMIIKTIDSGCGMDEKFIQQRLFKPFDTTKGNAGMGIGVYEAREYIMQQGGKIDVESIVGQGTVFSLYFPVPS